MKEQQMPITAFEIIHRREPVVGCYRRAAGDRLDQCSSKIRRQRGASPVLAWAAGADCHPWQLRLKPTSMSVSRPGRCARRHPLCQKNCGFWSTHPFWNSVPIA